VYEDQYDSVKNGVTHGVYRIYSLPTFVPFSLHPVAIEVCE
jgi:hypothetical protein